MRVLPVTNSGPTTISIAISDTSETGLPSLQTIQAVVIFCSWHFLSAPIT